MKEYSQDNFFAQVSESIAMEGESAIYDLEERSLQNAIKVRDFIKKAEQSIWNNEYIKQVIRSSASVGANYIEANEFLGEKDFLMKVRISRREAKETRYFLRLMDIENKPELESERMKLVQEAGELRKILSTILKKRISNQTKN